MHQAAYQWISKVKRDYPDLFVNKKVIEFGSMYINGTVRDFFKDCDYKGIDWRPGPMVDIVSPAHLYSDSQVDVVITAETLEHDIYWRETLKNAMNILKYNGVLVVTCAGPYRPAHCLEAGENYYYQNVSAPDIYNQIFSRVSRIVLEEDHQISSETNLPAHDTYVLAWKGNNNQ